MSLQNPLPEQPQGERGLEESRPFLLHALGVTQGSHRAYHLACVEQIERIEECQTAILDRDVRKDVSKTIGTLWDIVRNCEEDPDDIRQEIALPSLMRRFADGLDEYLKLVSAPNQPRKVLDRIDEIKEMIDTAPRWLERLLEQMRSNDGSEAIFRVRIMSQIFQQPESGDSRETPALKQQGETP